MQTCSINGKMVQFCRLVKIVSVCYSKFGKFCNKNIWKTTSFMMNFDEKIKKAILTDKKSKVSL
jgi:hypothetical protein